jgi:toxin ParE1/3/4
LIDASRRLMHLPARGHKVPELTSTHRECFVYRYRMIYRIEEKHVLIVGVIHGKRLLESVERFNP